MIVVSINNNSNNTNTSTNTNTDNSSNGRLLMHNTGVLSLRANIILAWVWLIELKVRVTLVRVAKKPVIMEAGTHKMKRRIRKDPLRSRHISSKASHIRPELDSRT
jgi:hypothetical protein